MGVARRTWMVLPAALGALLGAGVGAPAATHPAAKVVSAKVSGASVVFTVDVTLAAKTCKGTVRLSAAGRHWSGAAGRSGKSCHARIRGRLPKKQYGKSLTFRFSFKGRSGSARLKLVPPAPTPTQTTTTTTTPTTTTTTTTTQTQPPAAGPPDYVNGYWLQSSGWTPAGTSAVTVTVTSGHVTDVHGNFQVKCSNDTQTFNYGFGYQQQIGVLPDGSFSGEYDKDIGVPGYVQHLRAAGQLNDGTGTLTLTMTGYIAGYNDCHGTATGPIYRS